MCSSVVIYEPKEAHACNMELEIQGVFLIYCLSLYVHIIKFVLHGMFNNFTV